MGDVFVEYSEKNHENLPALMIVQGGGTILRDESDRNLMYDKANLSNYKMVQEGDFIVHLRSFEGGLEIATNTGIISPAYHTLHGDNTDSRFYYSYFRSRKFIDSDLKPHVYGIRDGRSIDIDGMKSIQIPYTSFSEQRAIGDYIENLENLITLHQRKHLIFMHFELKMVALKTETKNANTWEQRELKDVTQRVQGNDGRMDLPTLTISAGYGWLDQRDRFSANIAGKEQKNYTLLRKGELSYNHGNSKLAKYGIVFSLQTYEEALVPRVYHSFKVTDEADADFIEYVFATKLPDKELGKLISSGARMDGLLNINYDEFMGIKITMPSVEEQKQLSDYFRHLDHLITLHQRKPFLIRNGGKRYVRRI